MIQIDIVTGFPKLLTGPLQESILGRAQDKELVRIQVHDLREHTADRHRTIDDVPYGGGAGMVLKPEPLAACIDALRAAGPCDEIIYLTADGERLTQRLAVELSLKSRLILICGHYKGIDERIRQSMITREISIGDYVLTGGELPALVLTDSVVRLVPGVLHDAESLLSDSFQDDLLGAPCYTRPPEFRGMRVPEVLLTGNHQEIAAWRAQQQRTRTEERRKDLLEPS